MPSSRKVVIREVTELMDYLLELDRFAPKGGSHDIIDQAAEAVSEIDGHRPLAPEVIDRLEKEILADRVHSSAVTEGNRLSRRETLVVLTSGIVEAGPRKDAMEVRNLARAIIALEEALKSGVPLTSSLIREFHRILLTDIDDQEAGAFRREDVLISGAAVRPPVFLEVPPAIDAVLRQLLESRESAHPIQLAAWAHWAITRIHPFKDGNGRMARLIQDYALLDRHCVPAPLRSEDREGGYYAALESADHGDGRQLLEMIAKNTLRMADRYLSIIREEDAKRVWVSNITRAAREKVQQTTHRRFLSLQRAATILKTEFFDLVAELSQGIPDTDIHFRDFGSLDFEKFQQLEQKGRAERTWFFGVDVKVGGSALRHIFWFGSHRNRADDIVEGLPSRVVILVSGEEEQNYYRLLDDLEESRITVRELVPDGGTFWRRRWNPLTEQHEWDTGISGAQVARDFMEEVLKKLGLV